MPVSTRGMPPDIDSELVADYRIRPGTDAANPASGFADPVWIYRVHLDIDIATGADNTLEWEALRIALLQRTSTSLNVARGIVKSHVTGANLTPPIENLIDLALTIPPGRAGDVRALGGSPDVDSVFIEDHALPGVNGALRRIFRIHLDVPFDDRTEWEALNAAMAAKNKADAYRLITGRINVDARGVNRNLLGIIATALHHRP